MRGELADELDEWHRTVGAKVREVRLRKGLTQRRLADLARIDRGYLLEIEQGRRNASMDVIWRLARGCGVEVELSFLGDPDDPPPP